MLKPSFGMMFGSILVWLLWLALSVAVLAFFLRGMHALAQIPSRLERIERILAERLGDSDPDAGRDH